MDKNEIKLESNQEGIEAENKIESPSSPSLPSEMPNAQTKPILTPRTPLLNKSNVNFVKRKIILILSGLVLVNIGVWVATAIAFRNFPTLLGTAALAYTLGLRHAVDADHLA